MMLDERRNLFPDDLQWFGMKILTQKFALFGFLGVEGKEKMEFCGCLLGLERKSYFNLHRDILDISLENERNSLGKEHNSIYIYSMCLIQGMGRKSKFQFIITNRKLFFSLIKKKKKKLFFSYPKLSAPNLIQIDENTTYMT